MISRSCVLVVLAVWGFRLYAQYGWEYGVALGPSNSLTDIGGWDKPRRDFVWDMKLQMTRWQFGIFVKRHMDMVHPNLWVGARLSWIRIEGADSLSIYPPRRFRNLSFRNDLIEFLVTGEWVYYVNYDVGRTGRYREHLRLYLLGGLGITYSNPMAKYRGRWVALRPLRTEGQEKPYSPFVPVFAFGPGVNFTHNKRYRFSWEFLWRIPLPFLGNSDYLDDIHDRYPEPDKLPNDLARALSNRTHEVPRDNWPYEVIGVEQYGPGSPRGNPKDDDNYLSTYFTFSYVIRSRQRFYTKKYAWVVRKKKVYRRRTRAKF